MKTYRLIFAIAAVFSIPFASMKGQSAGNEVLPFVRVSHDPVSAAMGGAGLVNASAYSSFDNAAAITFWDKTFDVGASYQAWSMAETQYMTLGAAWQIGKVAVTIGGTYGLDEKYELYDNSGSFSGTYRPYELQVNAGVAWKFLPYLSIGANFKYLSNKLTSSQNNEAFAVDAFLMTKLSDFRIAAGVSSVGTSVEAASGKKFSLPASVTVAGGYDHTFAEKHGLNVALDLDYYLSDTFAAAVGAEYCYNKIVSVRAGYNYGGDSVIPSYFSAGVGVQVIGIRLDFAYSHATESHSPLEDTFTVGLGYSF